MQSSRLWSVITIVCSRNVCQIRTISIQLVGITSLLHRELDQICIPQYQIFLALQVERKDFIQVMLKQNLMGGLNQRITLQSNSNIHRTTRELRLPPQAILLRNNEPTIPHILLKVRSHLNRPGKQTSLRRPQRRRTLDILHRTSELMRTLSTHRYHIHNSLTQRLATKPQIWCPILRPTFNSKHFRQ